MADALAPKDSAVYLAVRDAATLAGVEPAFQDMCVLLKAPPSLKSFILVVRNIKHMLTILPSNFQFDEDRFPGWTEMTDWAWDNQDALIELAGEALASKAHSGGKSHIDVIPHPMQGFGLAPGTGGFIGKSSDFLHFADKYTFNISPMPCSWRLGLLPVLFWCS